VKKKESKKVIVQGKKSEKKQKREEKERKKFYIQHIYKFTKLTRPPKGVGGGEGVGSYFADRSTVQYSRSLFHRQ
jgi:hypothetical protein